MAVSAIHANVTQLNNIHITFSDGLDMDHTTCLVH